MPVGTRVYKQGTHLHSCILTLSQLVFFGKSEGRSCETSVTSVLVICRLLPPAGNSPMPCSARRVYTNIVEIHRRSHERTSTQPKARAAVLGRVQRAIEDASTAWGNPTPTACALSIRVLSCMLTPIHM